MLNRIHCPVRWFALPLAGVLALGVGVASDAGEVKQADVTKTLGPSFFVDEAAPGGKDVTAQQSKKLLKKLDFAADKPLNVGKGGSEITITGIGWASPNQPEVIDAQQLELTIRYLGKDGEPGKDDVEIGSTTATLKFTEGGEYAWVFDEPMVAVIDGKNAQFRMEITPINAAGDGTIRVKAGNEGAKFSVAGKSKAVD